MQQPAVLWRHRAADGGARARQLRPLPAPHAVRRSCRPRAAAARARSARFFMGLTMGVVGAPCIGPIVAALLLYVGAQQSARARLRALLRARARARACPTSPWRPLPAGCGGCRAAAPGSPGWSGSSASCCSGSRCTSSRRCCRRACVHGAVDGAARRRGRRARASSAPSPASRWATAGRAGWRASRAIVVGLSGLFVAEAREPDRLDAVLRRRRSRRRPTSRPARC